MPLSDTKILHALVAMGSAALAAAAASPRKGDQNVLHGIMKCYKWREKNSVVSNYTFPSKYRRTFYYIHIPM